MNLEKIPTPETIDLSASIQTIPAWLKWLAGSSVVSSFAYGSTYLTGLVYHQAYLSYFDIPSDLFKGATSEYFIHAYRAWLEFVPEWVNKIMGDYRPMALFFFLMLLAASTGGLLALLSQTRKGKKWHEKIKGSRPLYITATLVGLPAVSVGAIVTGFAIVALLMLIPASIGELGAAKAYARSQKRYASKCEVSAPRTNCVELVEEGKVLATGYVLETSDRYIALLTPDGTKIFPLKERAMQVHRPVRKPGF